jgi:O-antigen ligase
LYQNNLTTFNLDNLYLIVFGFGAMQIFIINQLFDNNNNNNVKYLLYASLMICFIASNVNFFFFIKYTNYDLFIDFFNKKDFRNFYDSILGVKFFLNENIPRSTGISRTFGLINIAIIIYLLFVIKKKTVKYLFYSISFIYTSLIWLLQSRGSILIFFITIAVIIFILKKINIKKKIYLFFFLFLLPIFSVEMIFFSFKLNIYNSSYIKKFIDRQDSKPIRITTDFSSSGRLTIWEESLKNFDKNKIFGYGPQGDRFLLTGLNNLDKYSNNASNALIYSLLSGGYFAITIFLLIYFNILNKIYIFFKKIKILEKKKDVNINLSISYVIFFFLRSFFENSFSLFGIDFLIFICSAVYIENYLKENKALF